MKIFCEDPRGYRGRLHVGNLIDTRSGLLFKKVVDKNRHYMKLVEGYGIQKEVFDRYLRGKRGRVMLIEHDGETKTYLVASIHTWTKHSSYQNFGDGEQVFLSRRFMHNADDFSRERPTVVTEIHPDVRTRLKQMWDNRDKTTT